MDQLTQGYSKRNIFLECNDNHPLIKTEGEFGAIHPYLKYLRLNLI